MEARDSQFGYGIPGIIAPIINHQPTINAETRGRLPKYLRKTGRCTQRGRKYSSKSQNWWAGWQKKLKKKHWNIRDPLDVSEKSHPHKVGKRRYSWLNQQAYVRVDWKAVIVMQQWFQKEIFHPQPGIFWGLYSCLMRANLWTPALALIGVLHTQTDFCKKETAPNEELCMLRNKDPDPSYALIIKNVLWKQHLPHS